MAITATGLCQASVDASIKYARERKQFGRPIGSFQLVQQMIADMIAETMAVRLLAYRSNYLIRKGVRARLESSVAKAYGCETAVRVASRAVEIHGAAGLVETHPVARYYRDARMLTIPDGATQIQKLIIGRESLGIRAFDG
jgi:alkylation response protein AidB-like acyl-CoA dehydrogenase